MSLVHLLKRMNDFQFEVFLFLAVVVSRCLWCIDIAEWWVYSKVSRFCGHCGLKVSLVHWHSRMMSSFQGISILWPPWFTASLVEWFKRDDELISYDFTLLCHCLGSCPAPFCMISPLGCVDMRRLITCILMKIHCCIHCVFVFCEVKSK